MACRDWTRNQWPASFKGISFDVEGDVRTTGRRLVVHQYPRRDFWDVEDMGELAATVQVTGYIAHDLADEASQELLGACASGGFGPLMLPNRPPVNARCLTIDSEWVADDLGRFPVTMQFVLESLRQGGLISLTMLAGAVWRSVHDSLDAVSSLFEVRFNSLMRRFSPIAFVPAVARDASADTIRLASGALRIVVASIRISDTRKASLIDFSIRNIYDSATALAYHGQASDKIEADVYVSDQSENLSGLAPAWTSVVNLISESADDQAELATAAEALTHFAPQRTTNGPDCLSTRAEKALTEEVAAFVRRSALLIYAKAVTQIPFDNRAAALNTRARITALFDEGVLEVNDPETEKALLDTRNAAIRMLSETGAELPRVIQVQTAGARPAAVMAAYLYNDASRDRGLVNRNYAANPNFMPRLFEAVSPHGY